MVNYPRNIAGYLRELLSNFPAVAIIGARQVGKTTLARQVAGDFLYMDMENPSDYDRFTHDPAFFFQQHLGQVIFDEAQEYPKLFNWLRGVIDERREEKGRFIITGSSSPEFLSNISESLAGRIAIIELGTLKANEYFGEPLSPFYQIFQSHLTKDQVPTNMTPRPSDQTQKFWLHGGYPEPISGSIANYHDWMANYQANYLNRDIAQLFPKLDKIAYRRFLTMLGNLSSKIINKADIARSIGVSEPTVNHYLDIVTGTFLWRQLYSFERDVTKSVVKMPRGHIRDSGLLHHLLLIDGLERLQAHPIVGFSFEGFVIEELLKGLQDARIRSVKAHYYRTRSGAKIDLILEGLFGILPIEIKYGSSIARRQLRSLTEFIEKHELPFGVVVNQALHCEWLTPRIVQIPIGCL